MSFEFLQPTAAKLTSVTPRTERHGDEDVFAISLGVSITGANTLLDKLSPTLRHALYKAADESQAGLPEIEQATPLLRATGIEQLALANRFDGWTLCVQHGIDEADPITLGDARVDKFRVVPMQGGSVGLTFRVGSSQIDATEAGLLCSHLRQEVMFTLQAPEVKADAPVIDGTTAAFRADHPDATDLFAGPDDDDDGEDEGSAPDAERKAMLP